MFENFSNLNIVNFKSNFRFQKAFWKLIEHSALQKKLSNALFSIAASSSFSVPSFPLSIIQLSEDKKRLIKLDLFDCFYDSDCRMLSFSSFWDALIIASFLKLLRMPLFFKYLDKFLQRRNWSRYFIKVIRVRSSWFNYHWVWQLLRQYILAVIFFYHFMVCACFLIARLFVASARSHVEHLYSSQNDESFYEATTSEFP